MSTSISLKKDIDNVFIYILLAIYLIFSCVLVFHFVLPSDSWSSSVIPFVFIFCTFSVVICIKKIFPYRIRLFIVVLLSFIQLFYYGMHESAFREDFHMVLGMFLFMLLFTDEFIFTVLGVLMYYVLLAIHTYESRNAEYLEYFFTPIYLFPLFFVFAFFMIKIRKKDDLKYANELESYKRRSVESEEYLHKISHILRRRLNSISCVSGIQAEKNPLIESDGDWRLVKNDIFRLSNHIDDIMNFSETSSDKFEQSVSNYSFKNMIRNIVDNISDYNNGRNLDLYIDISPDIPSVLIGDEPKISSIINRLVEDSINFTPRGLVYLSISARKESYGVNLNICVEDAGEGLSRQQIDRIFRLGNSSENLDYLDDEKINIQELNLMVIRKLVYVFGGFMNIELNKNSGKTVSLSIPQKVCDWHSWVDVSGVDDIVPYVFMKHDKFAIPYFLLSGKKFMDNTFASLNLFPNYVSSVSDIDKAIAEKSITHLFISDYEYNLKKEYFDSIIDDVQIVLIAGEYDTNIYDEKIKAIKIPFTIYDLHKLLVGKNEQKKTANKYKKFFTGKEILIVENEPINRKVISNLLETMGANVDALATADDIVNTCVGKKYDVIFMDYFLGNYNVKDVIKKIHDLDENLNKKTPVIAIISSVHSNMHDKIKKNGFASYVPMPITRKSILKCCAGVLNKDDEYTYNSITYSPNNVLEKNNVNAEKKHIAVTSESVCNLSPSQIADDGIEIIPYYVTNTDGYRFDDMREAGSDFMFDYDLSVIAKSKIHAPTADEYRKFFSDALKKADKVIHVSPIDSLNLVTEVAKDFPNVTVVDSSSFSLQVGNIVQTAARAANAGYDVKQILSLIETLKKRARTSFVLGDIYSDVYSNNFFAKIFTVCNSLGLRPVMTIKNKMPIIKNIISCEWKDMYKDYIYTVLRDRNISDELLVIGYAGLACWQLDQIVNEVKRYIRFSNIVTYKFSSSVAIRLGGGSFGFMYYINERRNNKGH